MSPPLYNRDILALAVGTVDFPLLRDATHDAMMRAPLCGSRIVLNFTADGDGRVAGVGMHVEACALGQASATLLARLAPGRTAQDFRSAREAIAAWFAGGDAAAPEWPGFDLLAAARDYPARHGAILLPFDAALAALTGQGRSAR